MLYELHSSSPGAQVTSQSDRSSHSDVTGQHKVRVADTPMSFAGK